MHWWPKRLLPTIRGSAEAGRELHAHTRRPALPHLPGANTKATMPREIYLRSYDVHAEVLAYDADNGCGCTVTRVEVERLQRPLTVGMYTREGSCVFGVYATPDGPVFFRDSERIAVTFGRTKALVEFDSTTHMHHFVLLIDAQPVMSVRYRGRDGVGTNPYDTEPADVDLFAALARALEQPRFFETYTKAWVRDI